MLKCCRRSVGGRTRCVGELQRLRHDALPRKRCVAVQQQPHDRAPRLCHRLAVALQPLRLRAACNMSHFVFERNLLKRMNQAWVNRSPVPPSPRRLQDKMASASSLCHGTRINCCPFHARRASHKSLRVLLSQHRPIAVQALGLHAVCKGCTLFRALAVRQPS